jgi:DNA-directed RNA polymerase specialized sigma subunit
LKDKVINETEKINSSNEAKEYLQQVRRAKIHIDSLQEEIETMKELAVSIGSMNQSEKVMSSVSQDKMADIICKIEDRMVELKDKVTEYIQLRAEVMATISKVDNDDYQQILYKRYCQMKKWEEIALEMSYTYQWVCKLHGRALEEIREILK